jgi:hypothetical protein
MVRYILAWVIVRIRFAELNHLSDHDESQGARSKKVAKSEASISKKLISLFLAYCILSRSNISQ